MEEIPITFEIPKAPEPIELVRALALAFKGRSPRGGEFYTVDNPDTMVDGCTRIRVLVPRGKRFYQECLWCLTLVDIWCLRQNMKGGAKRYPPLYESVWMFFHSYF